MNKKILKFGYLLVAFAFALIQGAQADVGEKKVAPKTETKAEVKEETKAVKKEDGYLKKPAWLTEVSLTLKESYDSNVFATEAGELSNRDTAITTVTPTVSINFSKMIDWDKDDEKLFEILSLGYSPEIANYHDIDGESYTNHKISNQVKGQEGDFSYNVQNTFNFVDGSRDGVIYPTSNAHSTGNPRERRKQIQDRFNFSLKYNIDEDWFIRPTASLLYYDLMTRHSAVAGYQNWVDRYDVNGGLDFGYNIKRDLAIVTGYRFGAQDHDHSPFTTVNQSNYYHRALVGLEGKIVKWLKIQTLVGPDFRDYTSTSRVGDAPRLYAEGSLTADVTKDDVLKFNTKAWEWVSSTGTSASLENSYELTYTRKWCKSFTSDIGFKLFNIDYDNPPTLCNDTCYSVPVKLTYKIDDHWSVSAEYQYSLGENDVDTGAVQGREFDRHIVAVTTKFTY